MSETQTAAFAATPLLAIPMELHLAPLPVSLVTVQQSPDVASHAMLFTPLPNDARATTYASDPTDTNTNTV